jgi:hypothetical protein
MAFQILSEKGEKLGQLQFSLFISTLQNPNFASRSCSNRRDKHYTTFVKVVEGSEIYNFPIHHFVHFYSTFWRKTRSKLLTPKFGKESDLWVRLDEESVRWKEGFSQMYSAERSAVGCLFPFSKGTIEADFAGLDGDVAQVGRTNGWISDQA